MLRKTTAITLIFMLVFTMMGTTSFVGASTKDKLNDIDNKIEKKEDKIEKNKEEEQKLSDKISSLETSIAAAEKELAKLKKKISTLNEKIKKVNKKIKKLETKIETQEDTLQVRLRTMYKNGNLGVIEVLLGSVNIQEFMSNFKMIKELHKSDVTILEELEENRENVEEKKKELDTLATELKNNESEQKTKQSELKADKKEIAEAKAEIAAENDVLYKEIDKLNAESERLNEEIANMQDSGRNYTGNGKFAWPFPGYTRMSSPYGYRTHPVTGQRKFHSGVDLAGPSGRAIVAAESGTVISSGWNSGGYGNMVIIDHGSGISTVYAHNSSNTVSVGQKVKRGQTVAKCGSTGLSTGPHLHFEVRVNGSTVNPMDWIN